MQGITIGSLLGAIEGLSSATYGGTIDPIPRGLFRDYLGYYLRVIYVTV
jgi:hypothetical protein